MRLFLYPTLDDIVSTLIVAIIPLAILVMRSNRRERQIAAFFGLSSRTRSIHILLSRYRPEVRSRRVDGGAPSTGYVGETVAVDEFLGAQSLRDLFDSRWIIASFESIISGFLSGKRDLGRIEVTVSPVGNAGVNQVIGTIVLIGTGAGESNQLAANLLSAEDVHSVFQFVKDEKGRAFKRRQVANYGAQSYYASDYSPRELVVLQRITMTDGRTIFLCAGKDASGSRMAAEFLRWSWASLHDEFGSRNNGDFARLYSFGATYRDFAILDTVTVT